MPALLTARNLPQTLLLTTLFLLVAVTTTLLACGPVAQPAPADDFELPVAQTNGGGEPTAKPAEPAITPIPHQTPVRTDSRFHGSLDTPLPPPTKKIGNYIPVYTVPGKTRPTTIPFTQPAPNGAVRLGAARLVQGGGVSRGLGVVSFHPVPILVVAEAADVRLLVQQPAQAG